MTDLLQQDIYRNRQEKEKIQKDLYESKEEVL